MSNQTEWQKWCAETAPVMAAAGRGEEVELLSKEGIWEDKLDAAGFYRNTKYRIKPRTIRIGDYDVPEPMHEDPEDGAIYYVARSHDEMPFRAIWSGCQADVKMLGTGMIHSTKEAADLHAKALRSLTAKKD